MSNQVKKEKLINGLKQQKKLLNENADLMADICPEFGQHINFYGAADITQSWINAVNDKVLK